MKKLLIAIAMLFSTTAAYAEQTKILIASSYPAMSTFNYQAEFIAKKVYCLLYTSDAADE